MTITLLAAAATLLPPLLLLLLLADAPCAEGGTTVRSGRHCGGRRLQQAGSGSAAASAAQRGESSLSPRLWPPPDGYLPMYRRIFRVVGRDMARQRLAMEAGWRAWITEAAEAYTGPGASTMRFTNYTSHASATAGLEDLESVDEDAVIYIRSAREFDSLRLSPAGLAQAYAGIEAAIQQAGVNATVLALYGFADQAPQITAAQLAPGAVETSEPTVSARSAVQVSRPAGQQLSAAADVQTVLLLGVNEVAATINRTTQMLAFNVSRWQPSASGALVTADVWYQFEGNLSGTVPEAFWLQVAPVLPALTARLGLRMSTEFLSAQTVWTTPNGTRIDPTYLAPRNVAAPSAQRRSSAAAPGLHAVHLALCIAIPVVVVAALAAAWGIAQSRLRRRQTAKAAAAKALELASSSSSGSGSSCGARPVPNRVPIDDGSGGWVTFDTDSQGRRVLIGCGAFAKVYLGSRAGGQKVALKVLAATAQRAATLQRLRRETALLQRVSYDANVVQFYGASLQQAADAVLVMEYCAGGNLRRLLGDPARRGPLLWRAAGRRVALDAARGLNFLHSRAIVHRDIKSSNILLDASGRAKVADVGLACRLRTLDGGVAAAGTFVYLPPEVLLGTPAKGDAAVAAQAGDCYAFGVVMWELVTSERPVRAHMRGMRWEGADAECCEQTCELIEACLSSDVAARPTAAQLVAALEGLQDTAAAPGSQHGSAPLVTALKQLRGQAQSTTVETASQPPAGA